MHGGGTDVVLSPTANVHHRVLVDTDRDNRSLKDRVLSFLRSPTLVKFPIVEEDKINLRTKIERAHVRLASAGMVEGPGLFEPNDWHIVALCSNENSYLKVFDPFSSQCRVHEITESDDFLAEETYQRIKAMVVSHSKVAFLISFPCTGGCPWSATVNRLKPSAAKKIAQHWKHFRALWRQYERLCKEVKGKIPTVLEWPKACRYWFEKAVIRLLKRSNMRKTEFHGCCFGYRTSRLSNTVVFIQKPTILASNMPEILYVLNHTCHGTSGQHKHATWRRQNGILCTIL